MRKKAMPKVVIELSFIFESTVKVQSYLSLDLWVKKKALTKSAVDAPRGGECIVPFQGGQLCKPVREPRAQHIPQTHPAPPYTTTTAAAT